MLLWHRIEEIQMLYQDAFRDDAVGIRFVRLIVQILVPFFFWEGELTLDCRVTQAALRNKPD